MLRASHGELLAVLAESKGRQATFLKAESRPSIERAHLVQGGDATLPGSVCARLAVTKHVEMAAKSQNTGDRSSVITGAGRSSIY